MAKAESEEIYSAEPVPVQDDSNPETRHATSKGVADEARQATATEHSMPFFQAVKTHRKAMAWAFIVSWGIMMGAYDSNVMGGFFAQGAFRKHFGQYYQGIGYQIPTGWQTALSLAPNLGNIVGIYLYGLSNERFGYRWVLLVSYFFTAAFVFMAFFAPNRGVLFGARVLLGLPWGVYETIGFLEIYCNVAIIIGQFIAAGVLQGVATDTTEWAYRIPWATQWVWLPFLSVAVYLAPESPWWCVRKGKLAEAEKSLKRLTYLSTEDIQKTVSLMVHTNELERELHSGTSYRDCFRGTNLWRTEITMFMWCTTIFAGFCISSQTTYFLEQAGFSAADAYKLSLGMTAGSFIGSCVTWVLIAYCGRRTIFIYYGLVPLTIIMFVIGFLSLAPASNQGASWAIGVLLIVWTILHDCTLNPVGYAVLGEVSSTRLRAKTIALGRNFFASFGILQAIGGTYLENPTAANWKAKTGFLAGGLSLACLAWAWWRMPETKGRTYEELDVLFNKGIPARKFKGYVIDPYEIQVGTKTPINVEKRMDRGVSQ